MAKFDLKEMIRQYKNAAKTNQQWVLYCVLFIVALFVWWIVNAFAFA